MRLLQEERGKTTSTYVYEQGGYVPLARVDSPCAYWYEQNGLLPPKDLGTIYYFHCNASGQPEEMTDCEGQVIWRARYSTWGKVVFENKTIHAPQDFEQNLRMQGQYHDRETGLYYNTFRYYDADTGRFTMEDPIGLLGGLNLYQYAPNPISWIDPWGWNNGRTGKQARLKELGNDPKQPRHVRGWIKQEQNAINSGQRKTIRNPPGYELAHRRGYEAAKGYGYQHADPQTTSNHKLQHRYDDYGRKNKPGASGPRGCQ